ncbi:unnamed protein product [Parnassius apollo]|uniref:RNA-directed DNA polymerase n=1 Tax=Parnassius apollo TaxID=110799 RepID=A0A8S3WHK4_PARAO|nr:unnamed protein product [Parnassius apollo]
MEHLKTLFRRLEKYGVLINTSKSILGVKEVDFLGYHISAQGTRPMETKVAAIKDFPLPKTARELRRFLGMLNYHRRCLKDAASTQAPLLDALCGKNIKGSKPVVMSPEMLKAFEDCCDKTVADALSRVETISETLNYEDLANDQNSDPELQDLINKGTALRLEKVKSPEATIYCDISTHTPRPYITPRFRRQVFSQMHNLSHPGASATAKLISERFVWPGVRRDCKEWTKQCTDCQRNKINRHTSSPYSTFPTPSQRFSHIHMDIVGPLPLSSHYRYCHTVIDRYTRWPEAYPLEEITTETCAKTLISGWVARFGCPQKITTDRGRQFDSKLFQAVATLIGARLSTTTSYHPQSNGMVERLHRQLKTAIRCHNNPQWTEILPLVLLGIRSAWKEDLKTSAAELVYGEPLRLPGEFFVPSPDFTADIKDFASRLRRHMANLTPRPATWHGTKTFYIPKDLQTAEYVFLRQGPATPSLESPYSGPYKVLERGLKTFKLMIKGMENTVTIDRLKPAYLYSSGSSLCPEEITPTEKETQAPTTGQRENTLKKTLSGRVVRFPDYYRP